MDTVKYIKSFSKGQITIPKDLRKRLHLGDEFWLRLLIKDGKIIVEPVIESVKRKQSIETYKKKLLKIKGTWFDKKEWKQMRKEIEKRIAKEEI